MTATIKKLAWFAGLWFISVLVLGLVSLLLHCLLRA